MTFSVRFEKQSEKFLKRLDKKVQRRILKKLSLLKENPFPKGARKVFGFKDRVFRLRIGNYRALYVVDLKLKRIIISKIDKRERVYKR